MIVEASGLICRYPSSQVEAVAVDSLMLQSRATGLVGVNGAGKTTLLTMLAGARRPTSGVVRVDGVDLYGPLRNTRLDRVGYMPQALQLPGELPVSEALAYVAWLRGVPMRDASKRVASLLDRVQLHDRSRMRISKLSGGMQRRLALAASLVTNPEFLILDEPTTGLDPEQRANLRSLILELPDSTSVLMSSHVMEDIEKMTQDVVVLDAGRVLHHGPTKDFVRDRGGPDASAEFAFLSTISRERA